MSTISNRKFPDKIYSQKTTSQRNIGTNGNKQSKKPTTDDLWAARQANYFGRHRGKNQQTLSTSSQQTRKI